MVCSKVECAATQKSCDLFISTEITKKKVGNSFFTTEEFKQYMTVSITTGLLKYRSINAYTCELQRTSVAMSLKRRSRSRVCEDNPGYP